MRSLIRKVRRRFGISAPKMTVKTHVAWYWRWLGMTLMLAASFALAAWIYDAGRRFAGFDRSEFVQELSQLREREAVLQVEIRRLRSIADASESRLKIEQSAQTQLAAQAKTLEEENTRLKEDLAFFENLTPAGDKLAIHRFKVEPDVMPGEYRYRLLLVQGGGRNREFQGSLQLLVNVQQNGQNDMISLPDQAATGSLGYRVAFRYFQRVEGTFRVSSRAKVKAVQVRVLENGSNEARVTQSLNLS